MDNKIIWKKYIIKKIINGHPYSPHPPKKYPIRKADRITRGQIIITPDFKFPRYSGSDISYFEIIINFKLYS